MYIYTVTVACVFIILLIFVRTNFSLSSPSTTTSAPHLLSLRCTQTHPHKQTHTQTNPHRQTNREIWVAGEERIWVAGAWFVDRPVKKGSRSWSLVRGSAWFVDRPVKKGSGSWSLVHGSAGEERIWVGELGSWIGR